MKKIIIAGSRSVTITESVTLMNHLHDMLPFDDTEIVSGGATGVDALVKIFARMHNIKYKEFAAAWDVHGNAAGPIRNAEMAKYADELIAFVVRSESHGTEDMINKMHKARKNYRVIF